MDTSDNDTFLFYIKITSKVTSIKVMKDTEVCGCNGPLILRLVVNRWCVAGSYTTYNQIITAIFKSCLSGPSQRNVHPHSGFYPYHSLAINRTCPNIHGVEYSTHILRDIHDNEKHSMCLLTQCVYLSSTEVLLHFTTKWWDNSYLALWIHDINVI